LTFGRRRAIFCSMRNAETLKGPTRRDLIRKPRIAALELFTIGALAFTGGVIGCGGDNGHPTSSVSTPINQDSTIFLTGSESVFQYTRPIDLKMSADSQPPALYPQTSLDRVREERIQTIFETPDNHRKIIEETDIEINGYKAKRIKFADSVQGARLIYFKYLIATGSDVWEITFQVNDALADQQAPLIERAIQTLKPVK